MCIMVRPDINEMPDRALLIAAARRSARVDPINPGIFSRNGVLYYQGVVDNGDMYVGLYGNARDGDVFVPFSP